MTELIRAVDLAQFTELRPTAAQNVFDNLDVALNAVLPGSDTHERYTSAEEVGLAVVVGRDVPSGRSYNPFDPLTPDTLSFKTSNKLARPSAWLSKETDEAILGGPVPEELGRFTTYALAKINTLAISGKTTSYDSEKAALEPGAIGVAGGQWLVGSLVGVSGLWEVHDHLAGNVFADEVVKTAQKDGSPRTADDIAAAIEPLLASIKSLHAGVPAAELSRDQVQELLIKMHGLTLAHLPASIKKSHILLPDD